MIALHVTGRRKGIEFHWQKKPNTSYKIQKLLFLIYPTPFCCKLFKSAINIFLSLQNNHLQLQWQQIHWPQLYLDDNIIQLKESNDRIDNHIFHSDTKYFSSSSSPDNTTTIRSSSSSLNRLLWCLLLFSVLLPRISQ